MIAKIEKIGGIYTARFERHFNHSVEDVWAYLTENEKLKEWFPELKVVELRRPITREEEWKKWLEEYKEVVDAVRET